MNSFWSWIKRSKKKAQREIATQARNALDHGYTLHQVIEWAYEEVYFEDQLNAPRKWLRSEQQRDKHGFARSVDIYDTVETANAKRTQERYERLRDILLGDEYHPAIAHRDITQSMVKAGVVPVQGHDCETHAMKLLDHELRGES